MAPRLLFSEYTKADVSWLIHEEASNTTRLQMPQMVLDFTHDKYLASRLWSSAWMLKRAIGLYFCQSG